MALDLFALALRLESQGTAQAKKILADIDSQGKRTAQSLGGLERSYKRVTDSTRAMTLKQMEAIRINEKFDASALKSTQSLGGMAGSVTKLGAAFRLLGGFITVAAIGTLFKKAIGEAADAEAAMAELQQAVKNAGGDFAQLGPAAETAAKGIQNLTRFSDDEAIGALATLTTITGDASKALRNIGLAADIAAKQHISLNQGAEIVGRVLTGNTRILKQYGIDVKESADVMQELRDKFGGFAEKEGATFQGRLEQLRNAFLEVLESIGKVVTGADDMNGVLATVRDWLIRLSEKIDENAEKWRAWLKTIVDSVSASWREFSTFADDTERKFNKIADAVNRAGRAIQFFNFVKQAGSGRGGGGGGGRDTPGPLTGDLTLPPAVVMAKPPTPLDRARGGGGAGGSDQAGKAASERVQAEARAAALLREIRDNATDMLLRAAHRDDEADFARIEREFNRRKEEIAKLKVSEKTKTDLLLAAAAERGAALEKLDKEIWERINKQREEQAKKDKDALERAKEEEQRIVEQMSDQLAGVLVGGIQDAFTALAESKGIGEAFKRLTAGILQGLGGMLVSVGQQVIATSQLMITAITAIRSLNPWVALAAGIALVALGSSFGGSGGGGGRAGTSVGGAFHGSQFGRGTETITRLRFVDSRTGSLLDNFETKRPLVVNLIGERDPRAARQLTNMIERHDRRKG
jgi:hypothetical protein